MKEYSRKTLGSLKKNHNGNGNGNVTKQKVQWEEQ